VSLGLSYTYIVALYTTCFLDSIIPIF